MLCLLVKSPPESLSFFKRLRRRLFGRAVTVEDVTKEGLVLRYIFINPYRRPHWGKIAAAAEDEVLLTPPGLIPPEEYEISCHTPEAAQRRLAARAAADALRAANINPASLKILLYDRRARFLPLADELCALCNDLRVVTFEWERYNEWADEVLARTGQPVLLSEEMPETPCRIIAAPAGFDRIIRTAPGTVTFTRGTENLPQNGVVYHQYVPEIPDEWMALCPNGIDPAAFGEALCAEGESLGLFDAPPRLYRQRICMDTPERVASLLHG